MSSSVGNLSSRVPSDEFVQLFTRSQRTLYLFILAQVGDVHSAEEILQETNLVIWSKVEQFQPETSFLSWARQIAKYEVLKHRQRFRRDKLTFSEEFLSVVADEVVQQAGEQERRRDALQQCLEKLQQSDRELIQQRYQPGLSGKDLAEHLGRPANSVYQSLGRVRKALLECVHRQLSTNVTP
ncbi:MAG TPA: sigma-70 family RNA polymerase sigma factor [Planctomicrobium sp.]|nr:sigma-70 family RNA polymerase sigma factor [Planctomicrobium sp.]